MFIDRSNSTTIGQNHYPAMQVHFTGRTPGLQEGNITLIPLW